MTDSGRKTKTFFHFKGLTRTIQTPHNNTQVEKATPPKHHRLSSNVCKSTDWAGGASMAVKTSGRRYKSRSSDRRPRRCRSRDALLLYCHGKWCVAGSWASAFALGSPRCRGGQSNRRCHRKALEEASSLQVPCHGFKEEKKKLFSEATAAPVEAEMD